MKRKFITNLALVIFLNLLVKPFWIFGIDRTVQNVVGADDYGVYFSLLGFSLLLNIILDMGIMNFNNRSIAREPGLLGEYFSNIVGLKLVLAVFYAVLCLLIGIILHYDQDQFRILIFLVINQFLASFILYLRSNISGLHFFRIDSLISVMDRTLVIIICAFLLWGNVGGKRFQIEWYVYAQTLAYLLTAIVSFGIVRARAGYFRMRLDPAYFRKILQQSYPFALLVLLMSFYSRLDSVMLERMLSNGKEQAGIYAQSFRILDAAAMFAFLFAGLLLPIFSRMLKNKQPVVEMVELSYSMILIPAVTLAGLGYFYPGEIMGWMYSEHIESSSKIFPLLMLGFLGISTTYIFGTLLTANKNLRALNLLALSAVIINFLLNIILIPSHQAFGAAISSLVTQAYMAIGQVIISLRRLKLNFNSGFLIKILLYVIILAGGGFLIKQLIDLWYAGALALILLSLLLALGTRLLRVGDIYRIIREEES